MSDALPSFDVPLQERLSETKTLVIPGKADQIWDHLLAPVPQEGFGGLLDVYQIDPEPGTGYPRRIQRYGYDLIDVELLETITASQHPNHYAISQRLLRYLPYNPSERLPDTIAPDILPDPDRWFERDVGRNPWLSRTNVVLTDTPEGCETVMTISIDTAKPLGWLQRRRWRSEVGRNFSFLEQKLAS